MKLLAMTLVLFLSTISFAAGSGLNWVNFNDGFRQVKKDKKPAVIDFYTDWCKWCKVMDEKTFNNKKVKKILKKDYVTIKLNPEKSREKIEFEGKTFTPQEFVMAVGVQGFPATAFMDKDGKLITMLPGYVPAETFEQLLKYIKDECYTKQISFEDFQKKVKCP
jgi:thioredoxin-related protein